MLLRDASACKHPCRGLTPCTGRGEGHDHIVRPPRHRRLKRPDALRGRAPQLSNQPPSTSTVVPVTKSFLIRNKIADATSSAVPGRGIGWLAVAPDNSC